MPDLSGRESADEQAPRRILVTGGAGFIGSHLVDRLLADGHHVTVVDDLSTGKAENLAAARGSANFQYCHGSVGDRELIGKLVSDTDEVYHLAAAVGVALIARAPIATIERNIYPTELLLAELAREWEAGRKVKLFLASTSEVYGKNPKATWAEEDDLVFGPTTRPRWSYGASKAIDEFLALAYWREQQLPVVIARFFNVVGPRQSGAYGMVLPRFVSAAVRGEPIVVHDDGKQQRCFAHVHDVIRAVLQLMRSDSALGRVFNIGSDEPIEIAQLAQLVKQVARSESPIEFCSYAEAYDRDFEDIRRRVPDLTRLKSTIDFQPRYQLEDIVRELVELAQAGL